MAAMIGLGACGGQEMEIPDPDGGAVVTAEAGTVPSADSGVVPTVDAGPPPLTSKYTRPKLFIAEQHHPGLSCASVCAGSKGQCASKSSAKQGSYADCYGKAPYYIPRAWYKAGKNETSEMLECDQSAEAQIKSGLWGSTLYDFLQLDCCCLLRETQWLTNDVKDPKSCDAVCQARGLECGSHDRCQDIPSLCSKSFPKFMVQSIAIYGPDAKGIGQQTYPTCSKVPGKVRLESHRCVCL